MKSEPEDPNYSRMLPGDYFLHQDSDDSNPLDGKTEMIAAIRTRFSKPLPAADIPELPYIVQDINSIVVKNGKVLISVVDNTGTNRFAEVKAVARQNMDLFVDYVIQNIFSAPKN